MSFLKPLPQVLCSPLPLAFGWTPRSSSSSDSSEHRWPLSRSERWGRQGTAFTQVVPVTSNGEAKWAWARAGRSWCHRCSRPGHPVGGRGGRDEEARVSQMRGAAQGTRPRCRGSPSTTSGRFLRDSAHPSVHPPSARPPSHLCILLPTYFFCQLLGSQTFCVSDTEGPPSSPGPARRSPAPRGGRPRSVLKVNQLVSRHTHVPASAVFDVRFPL